MAVLSSAWGITVPAFHSVHCSGSSASCFAAHSPPREGDRRQFIGAPAQQSIPALFDRRRATPKLETRPRPDRDCSRY